MIREATHDDIPEILRMGKLFVADCGLLVEYDEDSCADTAERLIDNDESCLFVGDCGMIGGLVYPHYFNRDEMVAQELFWWVDPEKRGGSLGRRLFSRFESWAESVGAKHIYMVALASQKPVERLYQRHGYRALESSYVRQLWV